MSGHPLLARLTCFHQEILRAPQQLNHRLHAVVEGLPSTVDISRHDLAASSTDSRLSRTWAINSLVIWQPRCLRWGMQDRARPGKRMLARADASSAELEAALGRLMALKGEARLPLV